LKIKLAITEAAEESIGYKKRKSQKWLRIWNDETKLAIEEKKTSCRKYLQNKTVQHFIEYKKQRAIVRKMTRKQRRDNWEKFVKSLERDITGTQGLGFKMYKHLQLQERDKNSKLTQYQKWNGKITTKSSGMSRATTARKEQKRKSETK
jgi:hypothetical protein